MTPRLTDATGSTVGIRLAAVAPLVLATPLLLVLAGILPDPLQTGDVFLAAATVGWVACALPSPQDFSVFWHGGTGTTAPSQPS